MYAGATKRFIDFVLAAVLLIVFAIPMLLVWLMVKFTSPGPALYWSDRVGRDERIFSMPKFRSMPIGTPAVATHLLAADEVRLTPIGGFLRKSSIDELPQLWSILKGDMAFVGPRPALYNQYDLIELRRAAGVAPLRPGITGLAQVKGRDALSIPEKVRFDALYRSQIGFMCDMKLMLLTIGKVFGGVGVQH